MRLVEGPRELPGAFTTAESKAQRSFGNGKSTWRRRLPVRGTSRCRFSRMTRQHRLAGGTRVHRSAPPSESPGGSSLAGDDTRFATAYGRSCSPGGAGSEVYQCRYGRVSVDADAKLLLSGNEYPSSGGASGYGVDHRPGSGAPADSDRCGREIAFYSKRDIQCRGHAIECRVYARIRTRIFPQPRQDHRDVDPGGPAFAWTAVFMRAGWFQWITILCWPSSLPTAPIANKRSRDCGARWTSILSVGS